MGQLHVAMLHDKVMHAKVHVPGDILSCRLTTGIRQEICSRILCDVHAREHVAAPFK